MLTRKSFIADLANIKDVNQHYAFVDLCAKQGDLATLNGLFLELSGSEHISEVPDWAFRAVLERIIAALALTEGFDNAFTAFELAAIADSRMAESGSVRLQAPAVASMVVAAQPAVVIDSLLRKLNGLETTALLLHEAIIRGKLTTESSARHDIHDRLMDAKHPLASLPITLFDLEDGLQLPSYGPGWSSGIGIPFGPMTEEPTVASMPLKTSTEITEERNPDREEQICAAVMNWMDQSNGKIDVHMYRAALASNEIIAATIPSLGLESVQPTDTVRFRDSASTKDVFRILFSAASNGGAYNVGVFAAYGRLLAWRSLAGLVGSSSDASVREIAAKAQDCRWCLFDSPNEWFYQVAWDIGVICFNAADRELAVLAATDTD